MKTYKKGQAVQLSKDLKSTDFDCHGSGCCKDTPIEMKLVNILQIVWDHFGEGHVNCGYRCPRHNAEVSGASKASKHMQGLAADVSIPGVHPYRIARFICSIPGFIGRVGCYTWGQNNGFVHVDIRPTNSFAIYTYGNVKSDAVKSFDMMICRGTRGRIVTVVQRFLKEQKDENGNVLYTGSIDTSCGGLTEKAIIKWNEQHGRTSNVWDVQCWEEAFPK